MNDDELNSRQVRALRLEEVEVALTHLSRAPRLNLWLLDQVLHFAEGPWRRAAARSQLLAVWRGDQLKALAQLRPSFTLDATTDEATLEALLPHLGDIVSGIVKGRSSLMGRLRAQLALRGHRAPLLDRMELGYALRAEDAHYAPPPAGLELRAARAGDLDALVVAAQGSLLAEQRPDPLQKSARRFRRWVKTRVAHATVGVLDGRVVFVGYSDITRPCGWLLQGVFTSPAQRGRGIAAAGVSMMARRAFEAGAGHLQLAVLEDNLAGQRLYQRLGFEPFTRQRVLVFG